MGTFNCVRLRAQLNRNLGKDLGFRKCEIITAQTNQLKIKILNLFSNHLNILIYH